MAAITNVNTVLVIQAQIRRQLRALREG